MLAMTLAQMVTNDHPGVILSIKLVQEIGQATSESDSSIPDEMLNSENHFVALDARKAIEMAILNDPRTVLPRLADLASRECPGRLVAADAICGGLNRSAAELLPVVERFAREHDWQVRRQAALSLGLCHVAPRQEVVSLLMTLTRDEHWMVRAGAEAALPRIDVPRGFDKAYWKPGGLHGGRGNTTARKERASNQKGRCSSVKEDRISLSTV